MEITKEFQNKVADALLEKREKFGLSDKQFAISMGIDPAVFSRLKKGERDKLISPNNWLTLGLELGVTMNKRTWNTVETDVFKQISDDILFCKAYSKSRIFVDNCGIGKTHTAKYMAATQKNVFYIDCTQCSKKTAFVRALARAVGVELNGKLVDIKERTKYYLTLLENPLIIIDEAGALEKSALGLVQEYWNATENVCGWYMMGANALRNKIQSGVEKDRDYFAELFSRFSDKFDSIVPETKSEKQEFYKKLLRDVIAANVSDQSKVNELVNRSLVEKNGMITGLRRAESLIILHNA